MVWLSASGLTNDPEKHAETTITRQRIPDSFSSFASVRAVRLCSNMPVFETLMEPRDPCDDSARNSTSSSRFMTRAISRNEYRNDDSDASGQVVRSRRSLSSSTERIEEPYFSPTRCLASLISSANTRSSPKPAKPRKYTRPPAAGSSGNRATCASMSSRCRSPSVGCSATAPPASDAARISRSIGANFTY